MEYVKLKDICFFLPKSKIKAGEGMDNGKYIFFTSSDTKVSKINEYLYDDEAVIIGTGGKPSCNYCKGKFSVSTDNFVLKSNTINIKYLYYFLRNNNLSILEKGFYGAGLKHISKDYVSDINVPLLDYSKQCKIVSTLDSIYININFYKDQLKNFDNIVKSQFIEMFGDDLKGETIKLSDLSEVITKGTTPTTLGFDFVDDGINFIKIECISDSYQFSKNKMLHITAECDEKLRRSRLKENDILFSIAGAIGRTAIVTNDILPANTNQALAIIRLKKNSGLNVDFLNEMLHTELITKQVASKANGAAQINLSLTDVGNFKVIVPFIERQTKFSKFIHQIDKSKYFGGVSYA